MSYLKGNGYIRANNRWMGIPKSNGQGIPAMSSITDATGTYRWAPSYDTSVTFSLSNLGTPYETIPGYTEYNNTIKFYQLDSGTICTPKFNSGSNPVLLPDGAVFSTLTGGSINLNTTGNVEDMNNVPIKLICPHIETYIITCAPTSGAPTSSYYSPFSSSKILGRDNFIQQWQSRVGLSFPSQVTSIFRTIATAWGNPISLYPTYYTDRGTNYNYSNQYDGMRYSLSGNVLTISERNCYNIGTSLGQNNSISEVWAGQMLQDKDSVRSPEYHQQNATHFQLVFTPMNTSLPNGERLWGIYSVISTASLQNISLNG